MTKELDKLLDSIEEAGGFRDACTTAHKSSLEALEVRMDRLSEKNRIWQVVLNLKIVITFCLVF